MVRTKRHSRREIAIKLLGFARGFGVINRSGTRYLALSSLVGKLLYGIAATDPSTLALAHIVLALAALATCLVPARHAVRVNPLEALRAE